MSDIVRCGCQECTHLLSRALDLAVRARKLDAQQRSNDAVERSTCGDEWERSGLFGEYAAQNNAAQPWREMMPRSATLPVWVIDQYDKDLHDWERQARLHLMGCINREGDGDE